MRNGSITSFVWRAAISALGVLIGSYLLDGIHYDDNTTLIIAALVLGVFSAVLRPILVLFALPFVVLTMGLGLLVINALLYMLTASLVGGFEVSGFGAAFFGAFIITILNLLFGGAVGVPRKRVNVNVHRPSPKRKVRAKDDVIDI